jgi:ABC-type sugar transport system ATPase subunit
VIIASSDLEEVLGMGDRIVTLYRGRRVASYRRGAVSMNGILADITHNRTAA